MASHLWFRGKSSGWTFQIAVPQLLVKTYGATPIRVKLGPMSAPEAKRRARILAGYATARMGAISMSRETVTHGLSEVASQLADLKALEQKANFAALNAVGKLADHPGKNWTCVDPQAPTYAELEQDLAVAQTTYSMYRVMRERIDGIGREIVRDGDDWHTEREIYDRTVVRLAQSKPVTTNLPILSVIAEEVINAKADALTETGAGYIARMRRAVRAFTSIIGDKKVSEYSPLDMQKYATTLGLLPNNWSQDSRFRKLPAREIVKKAERMVGLEPLGIKTITQYVSDFRGVWKIIRATYPHDVLSLAHDDLHITMPRTAAAPVVREGLPVENINKLLAVAAQSKRPDDRFLALLGVVTGARLGELTYLQVDDVQPYLDHWVIRLIEDIEDENGNINERKLKTEAARRVVALPDAIKDLGFLEWVQNIRTRTVWPQLLKTARPHATASKRQLKIMKRAGVHVRLAQTYHSLRHNYKDHLRTHGIAERTIDIQVGHALDTVAKTYGSKSLRPDEIIQLARLPLPEGLDLTPYSRHRD
jgi:integrase